MQILTFLLFSILLIQINYCEGQNPENIDHRVFFPIKALAIIRGANSDGSSFKGTVTFEQLKPKSSITVKVSIKGLPKGKGNLKRGLHLHGNVPTDLSDDPLVYCKSTGPHFNGINRSTTHGSLTSKIRHLGDYGNVESDDNGEINAEITDTENKLFGLHSIIGISVVLHEKEDDNGLGNSEFSKIHGNSGNRFGCGVIGRVPADKPGTKKLSNRVSSNKPLDTFNRLPSYNKVRTQAQNLNILNLKGNFNQRNDANIDLMNIRNQRFSNQPAGSVSQILHHLSNQRNLRQNN